MFFKIQLHSSFRKLECRLPYFLQVELEYYPRSKSQSISASLNGSKKSWNKSRPQRDKNRQNGIISIVRLISCGMIIKLGSRLVCAHITSQLESTWASLPCIGVPSSTQFGTVRSIHTAAYSVPCPAVPYLGQVSSVNGMLAVLNYLACFIMEKFG